MLATLSVASVDNGETAAIVPAMRAVQPARSRKRGSFRCFRGALGGFQPPCTTGHAHDISVPHQPITGSASDHQGQAMFAVIRTGGKQYRVSENSSVQVERLSGDPGDVVTFDQVLMVGGDGGPPLVGAPVVEEAAVFAEVVAQTRGDKVLVFKKKRRKNHRRLRGHRQDLTLLRITGISASGERPAVAAAEAAEEEAPVAAESAAPDDANVAAAEEAAAAPQSDNEVAPAAADTGTAHEDEVRSAEDDKR